MFNLGRVFCVIDAEYSIVIQNEIIVESHWHKKRSYITCRSTSKVVGNNKSKFCKIGELNKPEMRARNDCHFRLPAYKIFLGQAFHPFQERLECTFWLSAYVALLIDSHFICLFCSFVFVSLWNNSLDYHSLTQTITEMTQFKMSRGTYDQFWPINTELTTLPEAHARCKGVIHLLSFVFTLAPEIQCMNYLFSQNYLITILQAEKSVRYNRSSVYRGSKGVIKCNNYLGQQGISIGVWCYGTWGPKNYYNITKANRALWLVS